MRVWNLTDVETPRLVDHGMVRQMICVASALLAPGDYRDEADEHSAHLLQGLQHLISIGALAVGQPPVSYVVAKEHMQTSPPEIVVEKPVDLPKLESQPIVTTPGMDEEAVEVSSSSIPRTKRGK